MNDFVKGMGGAYAEMARVALTLAPYHAAAEQKKVLREIFGGKVDEEGFPFSPTPAGKLVSIDKMVGGGSRERLAPLGCHCAGPRASA